MILNIVGLTFIGLFTLMVLGIYAGVAYMKEISVDLHRIKNLLMYIHSIKNYEKGTSDE